MFDVISIGSATEDVFIQVPKKFFGKGEFCFRPGIKVEIEKMDYFTGGGATNTSVGFSRLGLRAAAFCAVGNDESAKEVIAKLREEKVGTQFVARVRGKNTPYSVILTGFGRDRVVLNYSGATALLSSAKISWKNLKARWFYVSSLHSKPVLLKKIVAHAKRTGAKLAVNPGQRELEAGFHGLKKIFGKVEVLMVNSEEALKLTGSADIQRNLKKLSGIGGIVVITDGKHGAHASKDGYVYSIKSFDVEPLDATGAGDAFGSGFTGAVIKGKSIENALLWGTSNANSVIQYLGTKNKLLRDGGMKKFSRKYAGKRPVEKSRL